MQTLQGNKWNRFTMKSFQCTLGSLLTVTIHGTCSNYAWFTAKYNIVTILDYQKQIKTRKTKQIVSQIFGSLPL